MANQTAAQLYARTTRLKQYSEKISTIQPKVVITPQMETWAALAEKTRKYLYAVAAQPAVAGWAQSAEGVYYNSVLDQLENGYNTLIAVPLKDALGAPPLITLASGSGTQASMTSAASSVPTWALVVGGLGLVWLLGRSG